MFMMKGALALFVSLALGYALCIVANKQKKGLLQTLGYTLGASIIALSLLYSVADNCSMMCERGRMWHGDKAMRGNAGMFMKGQVK